MEKGLFRKRWVEVVGDQGGQGQGVKLGKGEWAEGRNGMVVWVEATLQGQGYQSQEDPPRRDSCCHPVWDDWVTGDKRGWVWEHRETKQINYRAGLG